MGDEMDEAHRSEVIAAVKRSSYQYIAKDTGDRKDTYLWLDFLSLSEKIRYSDTRDTISMLELTFNQP